LKTVQQKSSKKQRTQLMKHKIPQIITTLDILQIISCCNADLGDYLSKNIKVVTEATILRHIILSQNT